MGNRLEGAKWKRDYLGGYCNSLDKRQWQFGQRGYSGRVMVFGLKIYFEERSTGCGGGLDGVVVQSQR